MDREANYVAVGAFVLLMLAMAAGFVLWYSDTADGQETRRYEIYFDGSVSGLSEGSTVRYLGVVVGRVTRIGIDPRDPARVRVVADVREDAPIGEDTGLAEIKAMAAGGLLERGEDPGRVERRDLLPEFAAHVRSFVDRDALAPLRVVVDTANGVGGLVVPAVFDGLPFGLTLLYGELDGTFPNHSPDVMNPDNLADLRRAVVDQSAAVGLAFNTRLSFMMAQALAPTGAIFTFIALWTGSLWGRPTWGTYWVWDARLTSELILLFLYLGFMALHAAIDDVRRADRASALLAIVGAVNVPIIYYSVEWWNTLHQGASVSLTRAPSMAATKLTRMLLMTLAAWLYSIAAALVRLRCIIQERE